MQAEDAEEKSQRLAALTHVQGHELVQQTLGLALESQVLTRARLFLCHPFQAKHALSACVQVCAVDCTPGCQRWRQSAHLITGASIKCEGLW